jgi:hypothetical protein
VKDLQNNSLLDCHKPRFSISCHSLAELDLEGNVHIACWVLASLATHFNRLKKLSLKDCYPVHEKDLEHLGSFIKENDYLHELNVSGVRLGMLKGELIEKFA